MIIIVDTNIVFSSILNSNGKIAELIMEPLNKFQFFSCEFLRFELRKHHDKLKKISKLTDEQIEESKYRITKYINFINLEIIPEDIWLSSELLVHDIDNDDIPFVALTKFLKGYLWTGDKILYNGLKAKKFNKVVTTAELWNKKEGFIP